METLIFSHFFINNEKQNLICFMIIKLKAILIKNMIIQELETVGRDIGKGEIWCFLLFMGKDFSFQMVSWSLTKKYWGQIKILLIIR